MFYNFSLQVYCSVLAFETLTMLFLDWPLIVGIAIFGLLLPPPLLGTNGDWFWGNCRCWVACLL